MPDITNKYRQITTLLLLAFPLLFYGQSVEYKIEIEDKEVIDLLDLPSIFAGERDSLKSLIEERFINNGYLDSEVQVFNIDAGFEISVLAGTRYLWGELSWTELPEFIYSKLDLKSGFSRGKPFIKSDIDSLFRRISSISEQNGFPFAQVSLNEVDMKNEQIFASLQYFPGEAVKFGTLSDQGGNFKPSFLQNYLMIRKGSSYNHGSVLEIPRRVNSIEFVELAKAPFVSFEGGEALVNLETRRIPANSVDAIIGILPNERGEGLRITGQIDLKLTNLFRSGKGFELHWRSFQEKTQDLRLNYEHPALFGSALDAGLDFELLRQDTSFLNRRLQVRFQTRSFKKQSVGFFLDLNASSSIGNDRAIQSFSMNYAGGRYRYSTLDRPIFPLNGTHLEVSGSIGLKSIQNSGNTNDSLANSTQGRGLIEFQYYKKSNSAIQFYTKARAGILLNEDLFINDAFRLGGLQSLRGFNENEFYATQFATFAVELRWLLAGNAYMYGFFDQGFVSLDVIERSDTDTPFGFGIGALLNTGSGMLNLAFAVGRSNTQPLALDFSKIHFGYVVVF